MGDAEKSDMEVLFPGSMICGRMVRPWTLAQAVVLAPTLGTLMGIAKEGGIGDVLSGYMDLLDPSVDDKSDAFKKAFAKAQKDMVAVLPELIPKALPHAPTIIAATCTPLLYDGRGVMFGVDPAGIEEAGKMNLGGAAELLLGIIVLNIDYLKNFFGPGRQVRKKAS